MTTYARLDSGFARSDAPRPRHVLWSRHWWPVWLVVTMGIGAAHVLHPDGLVGKSTYLLITVGAAVVAWAGVIRQPRQLRFPWGCVAMAVTLSAVGDASYYLIELIHGTPGDTSISDAFWLATYVALAIGLSSLIIGGRGVRRVDIDGLIDIGSFAVLAVIMMTQSSVVTDIVTDSSYPVLTRTVWTSYPILDAALLGVVAQALVGRRLRGLGATFLICGIALWLAADFASLLANYEAISRWMDLGWMLGAAAIAVSAWPSHIASRSDDASLGVARVTSGRVLITLLPLLVPWLIEMWQFFNGHDPNPIPLFGASALLVMLAFARSTRLVKARNRQEAALVRSIRFYAALAENSSDAVIVLDEAGLILNDAPNLATMLGRPGASMTGLDAIELLRLPDRDGARAVLARWWLTHGVVADAEVQAIDSGGSERWFGLRAANLSNDPVVAGMVINLRDITDRKRAEQELSHSAFHDSVTGLANRALFHDRLEHALDRTARTGLGVAVVYLDLDGFKTVNDSLGHEAGDEMLREVAIRLTSAVRTLDTVSRLGGDEFAILIEESIRAFDEAETVADRVLQSLTVPFILDVQQVVLSASIGIAIGDASCTASSMMRDADVAMYKAKTTGKSKWALYEPAMHTAALDRLELESDLHQVVAGKQLRLMYQPVVELKSNKVVGFEALVRWDHPTRGLIEPDAFIPIAESSGTMVEIGRWVLEEACRTAADFQRMHPARPLTMAVNLSGRQLAAPDIVGDVANALVRSGFAARSLILEMTESVLVQDADTATRRLHALRSLGVRVAIDDFGTGYSSLSYLRQFPIDILKIDRSFTSTISERTPIPPIVQGLLDLAKTLDMATVAEGIELDVQRDSLRDQQCEFGQGFLFSKPLDLADAIELLAQSQTTEPAAVGL